MNPIRQLVTLDKTVHQPTRLAILTTLQQICTADFVYLASFLGLSNGNLSTHLARLHAAGLIDSERVIRGRKPQTLIWLTAEGTRRIHDHWQFMFSIEDRRRSSIEAEGGKAGVSTCAGSTADERAVGNRGHLADN